MIILTAKRQLTFHTATKGVKRVNTAVKNKAVPSTLKMDGSYLTLRKLYPSNLSLLSGKEIGGFKRGTTYHHYTHLPPYDMK